MRDDRRDGAETKEKRSQSSAPASPAERNTQIIKEMPCRLADVPENVVVGDTDKFAAENFRRLKSVLSREGRQIQVIVITSPVPGDGKSFVAANLAAAFAEDHELPTLLLDADLRRPSIKRFLEPGPQVGFESVLDRSQPLERTIHRPRNSLLHVLPTAKPMKDPMTQLSSAAFRDVLTELRKKYRKIIIDTPPIVPFADADIIGQSSDGVLLVVRAEETPRPLYREAIDAIRSTEVLGTVINASIPNLVDRSRSADQYYYRYYEDQDE